MELRWRPNGLVIAAFRPQASRKPQNYFAGGWLVLLISDRLSRLRLDRHGYVVV